MMRLLAFALRCAGPLGMALALALPQAPSRLPQLRAQFERENDPVRRAKLTPKLGTAAFQEIRRAASANDFPGALTALGDYRDEVVAADKALDERGIDPEKHSGGYKELEISVREGVRQLNDLMLTVPQDWHRGFDDIRRELTSLDKKLFLQLFPRQPGRQPKEKKSR